MPKFCPVEADVLLLGQKRCRASCWSGITYGYPDGLGVKEMHA